MIIYQKPKVENIFGFYLPRVLSFFSKKIEVIMDVMDDGNQGILGFTLTITFYQPKFNP